MVDIVNLLAPISSTSPSGNYLKLDRSIYRSLRNSYNAAQSSFRQLIETPDASSDETLLDANQTNWAQLQHSTSEALTQSTKDLELLGWYISSQLFTAQPYQNLADSTKVLTGFIEQFWDTLHPTLPENKLKSDDEQGRNREIAEFRIKALLQLVGESNDSTALFMPLQLIGLIDDITFGDYLRAERSGTLDQVKQKAGQLFSSDVEQTVALLAESYLNFTNAETAIAAQCQLIGITPVSFRFVKANIADSINAIRFLCEDKFDAWPLDDNYQVRPQQSEPSQPEAELQQAPNPEQAPNPVNDTPVAVTNAQSVAETKPQPVTNAEPSVASAPITAPSVGQITNRDQAFQELRKISEFIKQTEPHSPVSFLLERAIRWGYMSLPDLMQEMTGGNSGIMQHINQLTGMDNLNQLDLSDKVFEPVAITETPLSPVEQAIAPADGIQPVEVPSQEQNINQSSQPEANTTQSSSSLSDFEW